MTTYTHINHSELYETMIKTKLITAITTAIALSGCATTLPPSDELKAKLKMPPSPALIKYVNDEIDAHPEHFTECNRDGQTHGRPMNARERVIAKEVGVIHLDKVRVVTGIKFFERSPLWLISGKNGQTCGYNMFFSPIGIVANFRHELTHIMQMERNAIFRGIEIGPEEWMKEYHTMNQRTGYFMNPYEREAEGVPFNIANRALR